MPISKEFDPYAFLGVKPDDFENDDAFKAFFTSEFLRAKEAHTDKDVRSRAMARDYGISRTKLKQMAKALELDIEPKSLDDMDPAEGIELLSTKVSETYSGKIADLTKQLQAKGTGKEEIDRKIAEYEKKVQDLADNAKTWETKYNGAKEEFTKREKQAKVDAHYDSALGTVKYKQGLDKFTLKGFSDEFRKAYPVEFDEEGNPYATGQDGKRIPNPDVAGQFLSHAQLAAKMAAEHKLNEQNVHGRQPVNTPVIAGTPTPPNGNGSVRERPLNRATAGFN